ncbi:hypothetical protein HDU97_005069 [Phlyctochytrium planicorne]|nr:hypothetical protein HDU97_005069 [Phlyctochytrium planicorne]
MLAASYVVENATIDPSLITHCEPLPFASGAAAEVFNARYDRSAVVIKRMKNSAGSDRILKDFRNEIENLSRLNHTRIVRFYGILKERQGISLVLEKMSGGSLRDYYVDNPKPSVDQRIEWALDIACGIKYLHDRVPPIIHRDIKSLNVLMTIEHGGLCAKVSDFGSAIHLLSTNSQMHSNASSLVGTTPFYQAPELLEGIEPQVGVTANVSLKWSLIHFSIAQKFTTATDVYAYGVVLSEIATWIGPFGCVSTNLKAQNIERMLCQGKPIPMKLEDADVPTKFKELAVQCAGAKNSRPTMQNIIQILNGLSSSGIPANSDVGRPAQVSYEAGLFDTTLPGDTHQAAASGRSLQPSAQVSCEPGLFDTTLPGDVLKPAVSGKSDLLSSRVSYKAGLFDTTLPGDAPMIESRDNSSEKQGNEVMLGDVTKSAARSTSNRAAVLSDAHQSENSKPESSSLDKEISVDMNKHRTNDGDEKPQNLWDMKNLHGPNNVEKNVQEAVRLFRSAAQNKHRASDDPNLQNLLGLKYLRGTEDIEKNVQEAVRLFRSSAQNDNAHAQFNLGLLYYNGEGVKRSDAEAYKWFKKSAFQGHADAQNKLGHCYEHGYGVRKDANKAFDWYMMSANQLNCDGQRNIGSLYETGRGTEKNLNEAFRYFTLSAMQGNALGQFALGHCYKLGNGVEKNQDEANHWFAKALQTLPSLAELGDREAQETFAGAFFFGNGCEKNYEEAVKWFTRAAEQGSPASQCYLGVCYLNGNGIEKSLEDAVKWFQKAANQGSPDGQALLGCRFLEGVGVEKNWLEAVKLFQLAADQGSPLGQCRLGICYYSGYGVERNLETAAKMFKMSAEQGNANSQMRLGQCFYVGEGVEKNYEEAVKWFMKAADKGNAEALYSVGNCYASGYGVGKNKHKAYELYKLSAEKGFAKAQVE